MISANAGGAAASLLAVVLLVTGTATAAPSDPDTTFSGDGFTLLSFEKESQEGMAVAPTPDGKLIVGGYWTQTSPSERAAFLVRLTADGSVDPSFGSGGVATFATPCGGTIPIEDLTVLADGRILTGGGCSGNFLLMRFNPDGSPDQSFDGDLGNPGGGNGVVMTSFPQPVTASSISVDPGDGAITLGGLCCTGGPQGQNTALARYGAGGTLDKAFDGPPANPAGGNGRVVFPLDMTGDDRVEDLVSAGGGMVAFTGARNGVTYVGLIDSVGKAVTSFSGNGFAAVDHQSEVDRGNAIAVDASGRLLVASEVGPYPQVDVVAARLDASGAVDPAFGAPVVNPTPAQFDVPNDIEVQADGRILIVGYSAVEVAPLTFFPGRLLVARLLSDGQPDQSFAPAGVRLYAGPRALANGADAALDQSGRLLIAGSSPEPLAGPPFESQVIAARILTAEPPTSPSNLFKFVRVKRNKRKGTASLIVEVPGPGRLKLAKTGKLKSSSKQAKKAGRVSIPIKPRGKTRRRLASRANQGRTGRAKVTAKVTFTPTGGTAKTKSKKLTLLRRG